MNAGPAADMVERCQRPPASLLDVGPGTGAPGAHFRSRGYDVRTWSLDADGPIEDDAGGRRYQVVWCSHVLEHTYNPIRALEHLAQRTVPGGLLAVTVPPSKPQIVGGHVNLYVPGLLLYQAVLAGIDLTRSALHVGPYDISLLVRDPTLRPLPDLLRDCGDIERLVDRFPPWLDAVHGFDGRLRTTAWEPL